VAQNVYFSMGTQNEQYLIEDIILESIQIYGQDFYYIPRTLVAHDQILGEDRLSQFKEAYQIEMYLETNAGFEGQGAFINKFGLMMEQSATLTVSRRRWEQLVGRFGQTIIPNRPNEGDLLYFPLTKGLFEIKFVKHQDPFYQLGKLYVYRLQVELFQYASEHLDTGLKDIDVFESLKSYDITNTAIGSVSGINITNPGTGYIYPPIIQLSGGNGPIEFQPATATSTILNGNLSTIDLVDTGTGYATAPTVIIGTSWEPSKSYNTNFQVFYNSNLYTVISGGTTGTIPPSTTNTTPFMNGTAQLVYAGIQATADAVVEANPTLPQAYGENFDFKSEAQNLILNTNNPFGSVNKLNGIITNPTTGVTTYLITKDSTHYYMDSSIITMDNDTGR
jgi:Virus neck protein